MIRAALTLAVLFQVLAQQAPRDTPTARVPGTASLSGIVLSDEAPAKPLRHVVVMLNHTEKAYGDTTVSDDDGRFTFTQIPAGRFNLTAQKDGYLRASHGAARVGRSGTPIAIGEGQRLSDVQLRMTRGAVLTGTIRDPQGQPMPDVAMQVWRVTSAGGERRLTETFAGGEGASDDRGVYRLWDLPPGEYVLQATPQLGMYGDKAGQLTGTADLAWARAQLQNAARTESVAPPQRSQTAFASIYYPGAVQRANASSIVLAAGEERRGLDMTMQTVPTGRINGTVVGTAAIEDVPEVFLVDVGSGAGFYGVRTASGTKFTIGGVEPGTYALAAQLRSTGQWAMADLVTSGADQTVTLTLQSPLTASGRVIFQGTSAAPSAGAIRAVLAPVSAAGRLTMAPEAVPLKPDGSFLIDGLMPGRYVLKFTMHSSDTAAKSWALRDARAGGQDVATVPITMTAGAGLADIDVTFTDRPTELGGRLQDVSGRAATDYFIVVFSTDERAWYPQSRVIAQTRPASDGAFSVRGLPAGEYWLAALTDVDRDEWFDPAFLRQLVSAAMKVTLADGEKKTQDIRVAGR